MAQRRKTLFITGASSGIGAELAAQAARAGYDVGLGYNSNWQGVEKTLERVEKLGARAVLLQGDLTDPRVVKRVFFELDEAFEDIDALVNNAGIIDVPQRVEEISHSRLNRMFAVNTIAPFLCAQQAVLRMAWRYGGAGGVIVNVSSVAARLGGAQAYVDYAASKGALDVLTKGLGDEMADQGVRVVGVRPGIIDTEIHAKSGQAGRAADMAAQLPMGRAGSAGEVARSILWLLSEDASYITGSSIDVSGGR